MEIDVTQGPCRGRTVVDQLRRTGRAPNAHVAIDVNADGFIDLLTSRIAHAAVSEFPFQRRARRVPPAQRAHGVPRVGAAARESPARAAARAPARGRRVRHLRGRRSTPRAGDDYEFVVDGTPLPDPCSRWQPEGCAARRGSFDPQRLHVVRQRLPHARPARRRDLRAARRHVLARGHVRRRHPVPAGARRPRRDRARADARGRVPGRARLGLRRRLPQRRPVLLRRPARAAAAHRRRPRRRPGGRAGRGLQPRRRLRRAGHAPPSARTSPTSTRRPGAPRLNVDGEHCDAVREWVCQCAEQWIRDFHLDGLRLDAIHAIVATRAPSTSWPRSRAASTPSTRARS